MADIDEFKRSIDQGLQEKREQLAQQRADEQDADQRRRAAERAERPVREQREREERAARRTVREKTLAAARYAAHMLTSAGAVPDTHFVRPGYSDRFIARNTFASLGKGWMVRSHDVTRVRGQEVEYSQTDGMILTPQGDLIEFERANPCPGNVYELSKDQMHELDRDGNYLVKTGGEESIPDALVNVVIKNMPTQS